PVVNVNWEGTQGYISWLNASTGKSYRLPTESEWEYVARAGTTTKYPWGAAVGQNRANCDGCGSQWSGIQTAPVGSFAANAWGLYDVIGNVWEWVEDRWHDNYSGAPTDGSAWTDGGIEQHVMRGGSWFGLPAIVRTANRFKVFNDDRVTHIGFRLAQDR
ncbi:MAG: formylglycine-generating enzyme family protein, partial [Gammaproteobacteria bacterium]|nr:formylglycine-generating enzyme family protein [Gammaproteobacteria bacterium]